MVNLPGAGTGILITLITWINVDLRRDDHGWITGYSSSRPPKKAKKKENKKKSKR